MKRACGNFYKSFLGFKFDMKKQNIIYLFVRFKIHDKCYILKWSKAITWLGYFFFPRIADQRKVKLFSSIIFLSFCFKKQERWSSKSVTAFIAINFIQYNRYWMKFIAINAVAGQNTNLIKIVIKFLIFLSLL